MALLDLDYVIGVHDEIILQLGGTPGFANGGRGGVEAALKRIEMHQHYAGVDDVFSMLEDAVVYLAEGSWKRKTLAITWTFCG
ncbi:hypothetical protein ACFWP0_12400 [Achromobacter sp. NPDC058515]|uniref:hypothetical protein n=1 Tax=Achromobacter sp. NPDC058515 TaxID=3346533 RepID=UPI003661B676